MTRTRRRTRRRILRSWCRELNCAPDVESEFLKSPTTAGGGDYSWPGVGSGWSGDGQNAGDYVPHRAPDRARDFAGKHPRGYFHEQSGARDEGAGRENHRERGLKSKAAGRPASPRPPTLDTPIPPLDRRFARSILFVSAS